MAYPDSVYFRTDPYTTKGCKMLEISFAELTLAGALSSCFGLACGFVLTLYAVDPGLPRNHPKTVRRRLTAILVLCGAAPLYTWLWSDGSTVYGKPILEVLGVRWRGVLPAATLPLVLVAVLYTGPIVQTLSSGDTPFENLKSERMDIMVRNYIVAPFAEEFVFRACMVPLLLPHLGELLTILICPLFFGLAHVHHLIEWWRNGKNTLLMALITILVQVAYTSIFGMFSAFLFIRTGHLASPVLSHSLCNMLGLPPFQEVTEHQYPKLIGALYVVGLCGFIALLFPLTQPTLFL